MSEETRFNSDKADPQMNISTLDKEFNIDPNRTIEIQDDTGKAIQEVQDMKKELQSLENDIPDADKIIVDNIDKANDILDTVMVNINRGDISARLVEVAAQLINAITASATSITGIGYNQQQIDVKNRALDIKQQELTIKKSTGLIKGAENVNITNNNVIMNREQLLKMMDSD